MKGSMYSQPSDSNIHISKRRRTRIALRLLALILAVVSGFVAFRQDSYTDPANPHVGLSEAAWWIQPRESNSFRRGPGVRGDLQAIYALPGTTYAWAVGTGGLVIRTVDSGRTWSMGKIESSNESQRIQNLLDVYFIDAHHGWAAGDAGLLQSSDGGATWVAHPALANDTLHSITFVGTNDGWVSGKRSLFRTTDGGVTWERSIKLSDVVGPPYLGKVDFVDAAVGWLDLASEISRTADGGDSWRPMGTPGLNLPQGDIIDFDLLSSSTAIVLAEAPPRQNFVPSNSTSLFRSDNGGQDWKLILGAPVRLWATSFLTPDTGWVLGDGGTVYRTKDGGDTWIEGEVPGHLELEDASFADQDQGYVVGRNGALLVTSDGGQRWSSISGSGDLLHDVHFMDSRIGIMVGGGGFIAATSDGGRTWHTRPSGTPHPLWAVHFVDRRVGWAVGDERTILRTTDGGRSWKPVSDSSSGRPVDVLDHYIDLDFSDPFHGWILGSSGYVLRTSDGGRSWSHTPVDSLKGFTIGPGVETIDVVNDTVGWVTGRGILWKTLDGGQSWSRAHSKDWEQFTDLQFLDDSIGWVAGDTRVWQTRDGGLTWVPSQTKLFDHITSLRFTSARVGWIAGENGQLWETRDGGVTWKPVVSTVQADLFALTTAEDRVWAVGEAGTVIATEDGRVWKVVADPMFWAPAPWYWLSWMIVIGLLVAAHPREVGGVKKDIEDLLISDRPLRLGDPDPFNLRSVALGVSRFLRNERTQAPLTLAVTGRWGQGKSSLMNLVAADLRRYGFRPVWFNAWHHQKEDHLLASLLAEIKTQAVPHWLSVEGTIFRSRLFLLRTKQHRLPAMLALLIPLAVAGYFWADPSRGTDALGQLTAWLNAVESVIAGTKDVSSLGTKTQDIILAPAVLALIGFVFALWKTLTAFGAKPAVLLAGAGKSLRIKNLEEQIGVRHRFAEEFADVTEALFSRKLVIFIDDLDRCRAENVLEVLESVNFLVSSGNCFVVMGMDRDLVTEWVKLGLSDEAQAAKIGPDGRLGTEMDPEKARAAFARMYLEKLVNIEVPVPVPGPKEAGEMICPPIPQVRSAHPIVIGTRRAGAWLHRLVPALLTAALFVTVLFSARWMFRPEHAPYAGQSPAVTITQPTLERGSTRRLTARTRDVQVGLPEEVNVRADSRPGVLLENPKPVWSRRVLFGGLAIALVVIFIGVLTRPEPVVRDSRTFRIALEAWSPVIGARGGTPRQIKRFLNRLRFYAMRQRTYAEPQSLSERLYVVLFHSPYISGVLRRMGIEEPVTPAEKAPIPEAVLVALATVEECEPKWLEEAAFYEDFHSFIRQNVMPLSTANIILAVGYPSSLREYSVRFNEIRAGVLVR